MRFVGKIDRGIYSCIGEITTENVVLTDTQMRHVMERHPDDYNEQLENISQALSQPDVILEGNKPNTGVILKRLENGIELILRLRTNEDPCEYENSVISFWTISDVKWNQYLRTKRVLYKRE